MIKRLFYSRALVAASLSLALVSCNQTQTQNEAAVAETNAPEAELKSLTHENIEESLRTYGQENPDSIAVISTRYGDIKVRLFKDVPLHRANFVRLTKTGFYDQGEFYRIVEDFAIQGGDSDNRNMRLGKYRIPQEYNPKYIHKKGALAMARYGDERNPDKESSSHNFYIVIGHPVSAEEIAAYELERDMKYTPEQIATYKSIGGEPSLDVEYTVFGEVIEGMDVAEKIAKEPVDAQGWPKQIVPHTVKITNK